MFVSRKPQEKVPGKRSGTRLHALPANPVIIQYTISVLAVLVCRCNLVGADLPGRSKWGFMAVLTPFCKKKKKKKRNIEVSIAKLAA